METLTAVVPCDPQTCWRLFTDATRLTAWVPGLRTVEVIAKERGMPAEVHFEFSTSLAYTLVYSYDPTRREVRWQPKLGKQAGVTGFARFDAHPDGTLITYGLEPGEARTSADRELGDLRATVDALRTWITAQR